MKYLKLYEELKNNKFETIICKQVIIKAYPEDIEQFFECLNKENDDYDFSEMYPHFKSMIVDSFIEYFNSVYESYSEYLEEHVDEYLDYTMFINDIFVNDICENHLDLLPFLKDHLDEVSDEMKEKYEHLFKNDLF